MRKKRVIVFDPLEEPLLKQVFNDIYNDGYAKYEYNGRQSTWQYINSKLSRKGKKLIDDEFLLPPTTNRYQHFGLLVKTKNTNIEKEQMGSKVKFIFDRKIF